MYESQAVMQVFSETGHNFYWEASLSKNTAKTRFENTIQLFRFMTDMKK